MSQFQTFKSDLTHSRIVDTDSVSIHDDEIAVKIESFAFTANNVTYGVAGDTIGYWKFFPAAQDEKNEWGCILNNLLSEKTRLPIREPRHR